MLQNHGVKNFDGAMVDHFRRSWLFCFGAPGVLWLEYWGWGLCQEQHNWASLEIIENHMFSLGFVKFLAQKNKLS